jgi:hypothetical protein
LDDPEIPIKGRGAKIFSSWFCSILGGYSPIIVKLGIGLLALFVLLSNIRLVKEAIHVFWEWGQGASYAIRKTFRSPAEGLAA